MKFNTKNFGILLISVVIGILLTGVVIVIYNILTPPLDTEGTLFICDRMSDPAEKYVCLGIVNGNATECDKVAHVQWRDACYRFVALSTKDFSVCDRVESEYNKNQCIKGIVDDPLNCEIVADVIDSNICFCSAARETDKPYLCERIKGNKNWIDICHQLVKSEL